MPKNSERNLEIQQNLHPCISLKGRPLIACPKSPTLLEKISSPLVPTLKSYIKENWGFLKELPRI